MFKFKNSERLICGLRCGEQQKAPEASEQEHFTKMLNFNYSLRHLLVSTPKKHLILIKNRLLPFKQGADTLHGSQLKHSHMLP